MGATSAIAGNVEKSRRRYALFVLTLVYTSSYVDRQIMGVLVEPIKADLGLSDTQMGFMSGFAFAIFYATLGVPIAFLADRMSRRTIITWAVTVWSIMTALSGLAQNFWQLALARVGVGVGEAGSSPPSHSMIADLYEPEKRAGAMAVYSLGVYIGIMLGFVAGGQIAAHYGWRAAFFVVGLPGLLIAGLVHYTLKEPQRGLADGKVKSSLPPIIWGDLFSQVKAGFQHIWNDRVSRHTICGLTLISIVNFANSIWGASFLMRTHGMELADVGTYLGLTLGIFAPLGLIVGGRLADRLGEDNARWRLWVVSVALVLAAPLHLFTLLSGELSWILVVNIPVFMLSACYLGPSFAMIQSRAPIAMRALISSITLFIINLLGLGLGPQLIGSLSDILGPQLGEYSLRYALTSFFLFYLWSAFHYYRAGRLLGAEEQKT